MEIVVGSHSINKGKRAERSIAGTLNPILERLAVQHGVEPDMLSRNLVQTREGGYDLEGLDWIAIEIKHHKTPAVNTWWGQTLSQAGPIYALDPITRIQKATGNYKREPILIWKLDRTPWRVRMFGRLEIEPGRRLRVPVDIDFDSFLLWFERRADVEIKKRIASVFSSDAGLFP